MFNRGKGASHINEHIDQLNNYCWYCLLAQQLRGKPALSNEKDNAAICLTTLSETCLNLAVEAIEAK